MNISDLQDQLHKEVAAGKSRAPIAIRAPDGNIWYAAVSGTISYRHIPGAEPDLFVLHTVSRVPKVWTR